MSSGPRRCGSRRPERTAAMPGDNVNGYVETDPTGRYGRFDEVLGKGAMKCVYRGFDEERGMEVAWNQATLSDVLRTPDAVQRIYSEVQLLSTLRHRAIIGFHASWVDLPRRTFNFITDLFSSGTLRSYRLRYPRVSLRAVRSWARQILAGLAYLHAHDPPVIHRDLKCDNLLVNGHQGQVKIADLGLAAVLREAGHRAHSVIGTPEFMAPEMYDEDYDHLVDVYSFGMCVLEMLTLEYPYGECSNPAQIYKKVTAGKLPDAFYRVGHDDARRFIGRCLVPASKRPSAAELLLDPFLLPDDGDCHRHHHHDQAAVPVPPAAVSDSPSTTCGSRPSHDDVSSTSSESDDQESPKEAAAETGGGATASTSDMTITGKLNSEEDTIFLKVQIGDDEGHVRNIYFPFDLEGDTAREVAQEMVKELDISDRDTSKIADMIEQEIHRLVPATTTTIGSGRAEQQHEYTYYASATREDDDDDENGEQAPPPLCYDYDLSSSPTSSKGSLCGVGPSTFSGPHGGAWSKDVDYNGYYGLSDDDDMSSTHSGNYSALHYQEEAQLPEHEHLRPRSSSKPGQAKTTRFGPADKAQPKLDLSQLQLQRQCSVSPAPHAGRPRRRERDDDRRRMTRNRSMVDMRSQLLHRTLVEELNRRLFFNTVGAVENIGFRAPSSSSSSPSRGRGRRSKDDSRHQYYFL